MNTLGCVIHRLLKAAAEMFCTGFNVEHGAPSGSQRVMVVHMKLYYRHSGNSLMS